MIQSAMMFALGVLVCGLLSLVLIVAFVRRTRRLTAARITARLATRRAEFESERDELRARHAVEARRLEREIDRLLDDATAYRLDSDLKTQELASIRADLDAQDEEIRELHDHLARLQEELQGVQRERAEAVVGRREAEHLLAAERERLESVRAELRGAEERVLGREREVARLNAALAQAEERLAAAEGLPAPFAGGMPLALPAAFGADRSVPFPAPALPLPPPAAAERPVLPEEAGHDEETRKVERIARDLHRMAGGAKALLGKAGWHALAHPGSAVPSAERIAKVLKVEKRGGTAPARRGNGADQVPEPAADGFDRKGGTETAKGGAPAAAAAATKTAEARFLEALAEIRALERAPGRSAGE
ncbi:hypothetical protein [Propylenella binzhouense]|uniref:Uncharacterized protein n=1 Tax=Propylenella binzhouense TaxID=2555902 RepID=A0A964T5Z6_9HYPH|nr:hypothetical protein [Propylenella binzhouense]MYZ49050.1 hypothetical protein [Propylenella binzhouense]